MIKFGKKSNEKSKFIGMEKKITSCIVIIVVICNVLLGGDFSNIELFVIS